MTDCPKVAMRDLLPDHLHGSLDARTGAELLAHLEGCAECRAELALLDQSRRALDRVPAIDLARVTAAVTAARPATPRIVRGAPTGWRPGRRLAHLGRWRAVAAVLLVVGLGALPLLLPRQGSDVVPAATDTLALASDSGPAAPTGDRALPAAGQGTAPEFTFAGGVSDLDERALQTLLRDLEALEALPHADPAPDLSVDPLGDTGAS